MDRDALLHDSRDPFYRSPGWGTTAPCHTGAVPTGVPVRLRLRTCSEVESVDLRVHDSARATSFFLALDREERDSRFQHWVVDLRVEHPTALSYAFRVHSGSTHEAWYGNRPGLGGPGRVHTEGACPSRGYRLVVHDPSFRTPRWHQRAIAYEVMLDSFRNGDTSNDPATGDVRWREGGAKGRVLARKLSPDEPRGSYDEGVSYYGGDLQGLGEAAPYLKELGITQVYLTPWTPSADYHGYSVSDPWGVEGYYGKLAAREGNPDGTTTPAGHAEEGLRAFERAVERLREHGVRVVGDFVLNHLSAQSEAFQHACTEGPESRFGRWFRFHEWPHTYEAWWDYPELPVVQFHQSEDATQTLIGAEDSVVATWLRRGVAGIRLDVSADFRDGHGSHRINRLIRSRVKKIDAEAPVIGEFWHDASEWLAGDMHDGVMDYRFRDAVLGWLSGKSGAEAMVERLLSIEEAYPRQALLASWRMLGSHDTARVRSVLRGRRDLHHLAATLQFTMPGVPLVYYGDEVGMTGGKDPANRGFMAWDDPPDPVTREWYRQLARWRRDRDALAAESGLEFLHAQSDAVAYLRVHEETGDAVIVALNRSPHPLTLPLDPAASERVAPSAWEDLVHPGAEVAARGARLDLRVPGRGLRVVGSATATPVPGDVP